MFATNLRGKPRANRLVQLMEIPPSFRGWVLPTAMIPVARIMASTSAFAPIARRLQRVNVSLIVRQSGVRIRVPLLDAWPAFEVFAFREYDRPESTWRSFRSVL